MINKSIYWVVLISIIVGLYFLHDRYFVQVLAMAGKLTNEQLPEIEVDNVTLQAFHPNGRLRFQLWGTKAQVNETEKITRMTHVNLVIYDREVEFKRDITILARHGSYIDAKPDYFELEGHVECNLAVEHAAEDTPQTNLEEVEHIRKVFTHKLRYYPALNKFVSPGQFKVVDTKSNSIVTGKSFTYKGNEEEGEINGPLQTVAYENPVVILDEINKEFFNEHPNDRL